ncbi:MAG: FtsX-like permease family protein [bacterium]|nr:FtsX-like permease family protein [bacterium]
MDNNKKRTFWISRLFLQYFSDPREYNSMIGDFREIYYQIVDEKGTAKANIWYYTHILLSIPSLIRWFIINRFGLIKSFIKISFRGILNQRLLSLINITSLTSGIVCFTLISVHIMNELSYESYNDHSENVYRIAHEVNGTEGISKSALSAAVWAPVYQDNFPVIERYVRLKTAFTKTIIRNDDVVFSFDRFTWADKEYFNIFSIPLVSGNPDLVLSEPLTVVINEDVAQKFFGNADPVGKTLMYENRVPLTITGVMKNKYGNSHIKFDIIGSFETLKYSLGRGMNEALKDWYEYEYYTYILLEKNTSVENIESGLTDYHNQIAGRGLTAAGLQMKMLFQPIRDIHLHSDIEFEIENNSSIRKIYLLAVSAFLILAIAFFNFLNLNTAKTFYRTRELGIRKVVGANRSHFFLQNISETFTYILISLFITIAIIPMVLPWFSNLVGKDYFVSDLFNYKIILFNSMLITTLTILSGIYPLIFTRSLYISRLLNSSLIIGKDKKSTRNILIVLQFVITILLISGTDLIYKQYQFMSTKDPGFDKEQVIVIPMVNTRVRFTANRIKQQLTQSTDILSVGFAASVPGGKSDDKKLVRAINRDNNSTQVMQRMKVGYDLVPALGLNIIAGRNYNRNIKTDRSNFLLNEVAVKKLGFNNIEEAIDAPIQVGGSRTGRIIGVVKNFHIKSLRYNIEPMVFYMDAGKFIFVRLNSGEIHNAIEFIEGQWSSIHPDIPFEYFFLDEEMDRQYKSEQDLGKTLGYFSILALITSCFGLYGLSIFSISKRIKEIGIRKILGASNGKIITILTVEYLYIVLFAIIIACPLAYFIMNKWLENFAYRINIEISSFILAASISLIITVITVTLRSVKAAVANPVKSLRYE